MTSSVPVRRGPGRRRRASPADHVLGLVALAWAVAGLVECLPASERVSADGPLPHLAYAPQLVALQVGAAVILVVVSTRVRLTRLARLLYGAPLAVYLWISLFTRL